MKKKVKLPKGTFFDRSLRQGESAIFTLPSGEAFSTSPVKKYFVSASYVFVETQNTIYETGKARG